MPIDVPDFLKRNAQRGLDYNREGKGGEGLTDKTLDEAREFAQGFTTESKVRRMPAWFARHKPDLDAPANKPGSDDFPGAGAVAWLIWGGSVSGDVMDAADWAQRQVEKLDREARAFDSIRNNKMASEIPSSIEDQLASALAEKAELQTSFETLASSNVAKVTELETQLAEATKQLGNFEAQVVALEAEKTTLKASLAEALANQVSASQEAAKIVASLGTSPVASSPADDAADAAQDAETIKATFLKMKPGAERTAFFNAHKRILLS